jgi:uncharacterized protein YbjQ (UPF0145 family)
MMMVTTDYISGKEFETLSLVKGSCIQSVHVGKDLMNGLKTLVGGELKSYTEMMDKARDIAIDRMFQDAQRVNADAIVCVRFATSSIMQSAAEVTVFGTAVKFKNNR